MHHNTIYEMPATLKPGHCCCTKKVIDCIKYSIMKLYWEVIHLEIY